MLDYDKLQEPVVRSARYVKSEGENDTQETESNEINRGKKTALCELFAVVTSIYYAGSTTFINTNPSCASDLSNKV